MEGNDHLPVPLFSGDMYLSFFSGGSIKWQKSTAESKHFTLDMYFAVNWGTLPRFPPHSSHGPSDDKTDRWWMDHRWWRVWNDFTWVMKKRTRGCLGLYRGLYYPVNTNCLQNLMPEYWVLKWLAHEVPEVTSLSFRTGKGDSSSKCFSSWTQGGLFPPKEKNNVIQCCWEVPSSAFWWAGNSLFFLLEFFTRKMLLKKSCQTLARLKQPTKAQGFLVQKQNGNLSKQARKTIWSHPNNVNSWCKSPRNLQTSRPLQEMSWESSRALHVSDRQGQPEADLNQVK